jgi:hypothetical protein
MTFAAEIPPHGVVICFVTDCWLAAADAASIGGNLAVEETGMRSGWLLAMTLVLSAWGASAALAEEAKPEFEGDCVLGLALGHETKTDCSITTVVDDRTYCFENEQARTLFLKKPQEFIDRAAVYYMSIKQPEQPER